MDSIALASAALAAVGAIGAAWVNTGGRSRQVREQLKRDVDLYKELPDTEAKRALGEFIEQRVRALVELEHGAQRDGNGIVAAIFCLVMASGFGYPALDFGGSWNVLWVPSIFFGVVGVYGLIDSSRKVPRDERGRRPKRSGGKPAEAA